MGTPCPHASTAGSNAESVSTERPYAAQSLMNGAPATCEFLGWLLESRRHGQAM